MKNLLLLSILFVSTISFSQEKKEQTFKERLAENFKKADSLFSQTKESKAFMKNYNKDRKILKKHIDSFYLKQKAQRQKGFNKIPTI